MFFSRSNDNSLIVTEIYQNIIERSRSKFFYLKLGIYDDIESRFDLIILHSFFIFYYFKNLSSKKSEYSQILFDTMFNDFDNNLREMGFGDIAVNKKMKVFVTAFYGRISQYSIGMDKGNQNQDFVNLDNAIKNNIYKGRTIDKNNIEYFRNYMLNNINFFSSRTIDQNINDRFSFIELLDESEKNK